MANIATSTRRIWVFVAASIVWACTSINEARYASPQSVQLRSPEPGKALVYFLRTPRESDELAITANGKSLVKLGPNSFAALSFEPGHHRVLTTRTRIPGLFARAVALQPLEINVASGETRFFHVSGATEDVTRFSIIGTASVAEREVRAIEQSFWRECSEIDARGLITISSEIATNPK